MTPALPSPTARLESQQYALRRTADLIEQGAIEPGEQEAALRRELITAWLAGWLTGRAPLT